MAREPDLKSLYQGLEADEAEMSRYRQQLAKKLRLGSPTRWQPWALGFAVLLAGTALLWLAMPMASDSSLGDHDIDSLQSLAASTQADSIKALAQKSLQRTSPREQLNARAFLCMVLPPEKAIPLAGNALEIDPRPSFRAFYLEYLLDEADEYRINAEKVEALMEKEEDELCVRLYRELLDLS